MPIWEIEAPDGSIYEIEGDVEPTEQELASFFTPPTIEPLAAQFPQFGEQPTFADVIRKPSPLVQPETGVVRSVLPGVLQPEDLLPAVRKIGGETITGEPGDTHPDIIEREGIPAVDLDQRGFTGPNGEFYGREDAAIATGLPTLREPTRLHSTDLSAFQPEEPQGFGELDLKKISPWMFPDKVEPPPSLEPVKAGEAEVRLGPSVETLDRRRKSELIGQIIQQARYQADRALSDAEWAQVAENAARVVDFLGATGKVLSLAGGALAAITEDVLRGDITPGNFLPRFMGGPSQEIVSPEMGPLSKGVVDVGRTLPTIAGAMALERLGVPPPLAFGSLMGAGAAGEGADFPGIMQAGVIGAAIPESGSLAKDAAVSLINRAVNRGLLSADRTIAQKAIEALAAQGGMQLFMQGMDIPAYAALPKEKRLDALKENIVKNMAWLLMELPGFLPGRPSATQAQMTPTTRAASSLLDATNDRQFLSALDDYAVVSATERTIPTLTKGRRALQFRVGEKRDIGLEPGRMAEVERPAIPLDVTSGIGEIVAPEGITPIDELIAGKKPEVPKDWKEQFKNLPPWNPQAKPILIKGADGKTLPAYSDGWGAGRVVDPVTGEESLGNVLWVSRLTEGGDGWTTGPIREGETIVAGEPHPKPTAKKPAEKPKPPTPPPPPEPERGLTGGKFTVQTPDREHTVSGNWEVVESDSLIRSDTPGYDSLLQQRMLRGPALEERAAGIAARHDPASAGDTRISNQGAIIVDDRGQVLSGNARHRALEMLNQSGNGGKYRAWMLGQLKDLGFSDEAIAKTNSMTHPVLVRRVSDYGTLTKEFGDRAKYEFSRRSNISDVNALRVVEQAKSDATALLNRPTLLELFRPSEDGVIVNADNHQFLSAFFDTIGRPADLRTADGWNAAALTNRVKNAVLALALDVENPSNHALLQTMVETPEVLGKKLVAGIIQSVPRLITLRGTPYDLSRPLSDALRRFQEIKSRGDTVEDYLNQATLFTDPSATPESTSLLRLLADTKSAKSITERLNSYVNSAKEEMAGPMLGGEKPLTPDQILDRLRAGVSKKAPETGELPKAPPPAQPPTPEAPPPEQPAPGKIIPKERADEIRKRLKKKLEQQPPPEQEISLEDVTAEALEARQPSAKKLDPTIFSDAVQLGAYYIESGLHKFEPWAAQMRADFGEKIEPYLKSIYETARVTIESPSGEAGGNLRSPGLQPGLRPPNDRIVTARSEQTKPYSEHGVPKELLPHLDPHQKHGVSVSLYSMNGRGGMLVADGTGVGKTREALAVAHFYAGMPGTKVIIITRAETIKPDWKKGTFGGSYFNDAKAMGVKIRLARDAKVNPGEIGVTTYENSAAVMRQTDPNTVLIWDESHSLKNRSTRGTNGDKANAKAKAVLFMSATSADKPEHIYYLTRMGIMEGKTTGQQLKDLGMTLVKMEKLVRDEVTGQMVKRVVHFWAPDQNVSKTDRNERFNALFDRMTGNGAMIKREISMQGVHVQVLKMALPPEGHELLQDILNFFDADTIDDLKGLKKAVALMHMRRQQEPFKIAPAVMLAQREIAAGRQVVIFVSRVNESEVGKWVKVQGPGGQTERIREVLMSSEGTAKQLRDALHEAGIHDIAEIHGEADQSSLEAMADFQAGKKRVVIATIESGGTGINLDDTVGNRPRSMIVVTAPFDAVGNVQAAGRIWRLNTLSGANLFYLFADTDVDDWNADIIGSKMAHLGAVVEGQVRRLDISNPESVNTDDFGTQVRKEKKPGYTPAPVGPSGLPKLDWQPHTSVKGEAMFAAPATGQFWQWYKSGGKEKARGMGIWVGRKEGKLHVFARSIPEQGKAAGDVQPESFAEAPENGGGGEWAAAMARHGTASGLPVGIPDGGPDFPRELMEASRRLQTVVRSRQTLRPGVLGVYSPARAGVARSDKIEVLDVQNQATIGHEMGHDIDNLLFPNVWSKGHPHIHSQASLVERIGGTVSKKTLTAELRAVSELMRGPITGSAGYVRYRNRATELIADWFSLYVHDPARARSMAPEWTKGFEAELAKDPNAKATVDQLHARVVQPVAPPGGRPPTGPPTGMPGAVPPAPEAFTPRDARASQSAERLVLGTVRRFEAEKQKARIRAENWRKLVPEQQDRNDVGAFVEGTGNLEIPGDTRDSVLSRMTDKKRELVKEYRFQIELQRQRINAYLLGFEQGEYIKWLEDYLPHFYVNTKSASGRQAIARFIKNSPNAKQRKIPTLSEAVEYGLIPISQDPAVLYEVHGNINWRVATNRAFLAQLKNIRTSAGEPVIVPASQNPGGWQVSNNPLIQRVYAHATPAGTMLWRGGAAIHPDVWPAVRQILETPTRTEAGRVFDMVNGFLRANAFAFSGFHDITLRAASLGAHGNLLNPLRGLFRIFERDPKTGDLRIFQQTRIAGKELMQDEEAVADAALHGLRFSWTESESYQHAARDALDKLALKLKRVPVLGKAARFARDIQHWRQEGLWRNTHDAFKIMAYHDMVGKALAEAPPGMDTSLVKERIASLLNDAFGGQEWQKMFWLSPQLRMATARFLLAPDWTLSTLRSVPMMSDAASVVRSQAGRLTGRGPGPANFESWYGNIGRGRFWTAELMALAIATLAAQWAIYRAFGRKEKGDQPWVWDNETGQKRRVDVTPLMRTMPWKDRNDPTRYYVNLGKRPEEILTWFVEPQKNVQAKLARPFAEVIRQITGSEGDFKAQWERDHETFLESLPARAKSVAGQAVPFTFSGNQFALSLPYRKGMTKYKAQQAFESAYELIAEPSRVHAAFRGQFRSNIESVLEDIRRAAELNGVDAKAIEKRANSAIRGAHYAKYFRAYQKNNEKEMNRETEALYRLGATQTTIDRSTKLRESLVPVPFGD